MTNALGTRKETGRAACIGNTYQEKLISELDVQLVAESRLGPRRLCSDLASFVLMDTYCKHNYNRILILRLKYKSRCPAVTDISITYGMAKQNKGLQRQMATGIKNQWQTLESSGPGLTPQLHH